jgi:hypothetical protein
MLLHCCWHHKSCPQNSLKKQKSRLHQQQAIETSEQATSDDGVNKKKTPLPINQVSAAIAIEASEHATRG